MFCFILFQQILASYSSSALQNSGSLSGERIYFPGQLESFPQTDLEDGNGLRARLNADRATIIPAEPPQGQFEPALAGCLRFLSHQVRDVEAETTMGGGAVLRTIPVVWARATVTDPRTADRTTATRVARESWCVGATTAASSGCTTTLKMTAVTSHKAWPQSDLPPSSGPGSHWSLRPTRDVGAGTMTGGDVALPRPRAVKVRATVTDL